MKLKSLIDECIDALNDAAYEKWEGEPFPFGATINTNDGYIDLYYSYEGTKKGWHCDAVINHDDLYKNMNGKSLDNFESFLSNHLSNSINWDFIEEKVKENSLDEWQSHGFDSEADFWHWKEGR